MFDDAGVGSTGTDSCSTAINNTSHGQCIYIDCLSSMEHAISTVLLISINFIIKFNVHTISIDTFYPIIIIITIIEEL